jgi:hypothetical protein
VSRDYRIQNYTKTLTIPAGSGAVADVLTRDLNGLLRGIIITPPASLTGSSYGFTASGYYTISTLSAGSKSINTVDSHNNPLQFPIASKKGDSWLTITVAGDVAAAGILTSANTGAFTDGKIVTIGSTVYRFKTVPTQTYDVFIGVSADATLTSLGHAINADGTAGVDYFTGTLAHPDVTSGTLSNHTITVTAKVEAIGGNSIVTTTNEPKLSWGGATLSGSGESVDRVFTISAYIER